MIRTLLALLIFSSHVHAQSVQPGIWKADSIVELNGLPLPASKEEDCITPDEAKDIKKTILKELKKKGCESTKWTVKGQKLDVVLKCDKDGLEAEGTLHGKITQKSYELKGEASGTFKMIPSEATISLKGQWLKKCGK